MREFGKVPLYLYKMDRRALGFLLFEEARVRRVPVDIVMFPDASSYKNLSANHDEFVRNVEKSMRLFVLDPAKGLPRFVLLKP